MFPPKNNPMICRACGNEKVRFNSKFRCFCIEWRPCMAVLDRARRMEAPRPRGTLRTA